MPVPFPRDVPSRFAEAWNRGDPDGIAGLFAADADFVNVVGLWWHDRESIRDAHAYGLRTIFPGSVLRVSGTAVRQIGPDAAVVHCRWTLRGQRLPNGPDGDVRRGVFSFVTRRLETGWLVVSAHNTDVVPGAESLAAQDGRRAAVNYRDGRFEGVATDAAN